MKNESDSATITAVNRLDVALAQKVLDRVADCLAAADPFDAERLLDEFVDRLRHLDDLWAVRQAIARTDSAFLQPFGGIAAAKDLIELIDRVRRE